MKIDGKALADALLSHLIRQITTLKRKGIIPTLAVIVVGDNPASLSYIRQKQKAADRIGAKIIISHQPSAISRQKLRLLIERYNDNPAIHGLIIQRPLPPSLKNTSGLLGTVKPGKDVDGFVLNSLFEPPIGKAILIILKKTFTISKAKNLEPKTKNFLNWLKKKFIVIIGRGETAGKPIDDMLTGRRFAMTPRGASQQRRKIGGRSPERLTNLQCATSIIHSKTRHPETITRQADIIITCVGKKGIITKDVVQPGVILIAVGLWRDNEGKLHGDYEESDVDDIASYYTPTPGGIGPVNVACLMQNLVEAAGVQVKDIS